MEVVVSAAVLIILVLGVLAAVDSVSRTAAANQGKTVASTLLEKDIERMRSYRTSDLDRFETIETETRTVKVGTIEWKITSKAQWVTDTTGEDISCAASAERGSYLRITSSVIPVKAPANAKPMTMSSIVAPQPGKGTLTALVRNGAGQPVVGLPVQADGPTPATKTTNAAGCAVFDESEAGSYKLRLDYSGWVNSDGVRLVEKSGTVSAGNLTTVEFVYDRAGEFPVSVVTRRPGATSDVADRSNGVIAAHTGVSTGFRAMTATGTGTTGFNFTGMFPFPTPYEVYSGTCTGNNPAKPPNANYFSTHPAAVAKVDPGATGPARTVLEPAIDVTATYRNSSNQTNNANGARVFAYPKTTGCDAARIELGSTTSTDGRIAANTTAGPGLPFGSYDMCVQYTAGSKNWRFYWSGTTGASGNKLGNTIANTIPAGTALSVAFRDSDSTTGTCGTTTPTS